MLSFTILPILGLKNDVSPDDVTMFEFITDSIAKTHCSDSDHIGYSNVYDGKANCANKTGGLSTFLSTDAAVSSGTLSVLLLHQYHKTGKSNVTYLVASDGDDEGLMYYYTSGSSVALLSNGAGNHSTILFSSTNTNPSIMQVGEYIILNDTIAPNYAQCLLAGKTTVARLEAGVSPITFREMEYFRNRMFVVGLGTNTNAIRYSNLNPTLPDNDTSVDSTLSFGAANELFYPDQETPTAIKSLDKDRLIVYSDTSISEIKYLANYASPFSISKVVENFGAISHDSVVSMGGVHFFYDKVNGFCVFDGYSAKIISNKIKDTVDSINPISRGTSGDIFYFVKGVLLNYTNEIAWSISTNGTTNNYILYYNYITGNWRKESTPARCIASGYRFDDDQYPVLFVANSNVIYYNGFSDLNAGATYDAYRIEPILNFSGMDKSLLLEIWFNTATDLIGTQLYVYYRGGDTVATTNQGSWTDLGDVSLASPSNAVLRVAKNNRYHQIKWGSSTAGDVFSIREIQFKYVKQGRY